MSNNNQDWQEDDELDFEDYSDEPQRGSGDDVLKKVRRAERSKDKQLKEALAELDTLRKFQRESTISQVLNEKGVNPKVAKFIPGDIELSADSISQWLNDNGDLFGFATQAKESPVSLEDLGALRQMDLVASGALTPDDVNDAFSMVNNAQSAAELLDYLYSQGAD